MQNVINEKVKEWMQEKMRIELNKKQSDD